MQQIKRLPFILILGLIIAGCGTQRPLDPAGPYKGDTVWYNADKSIVELNSVMDDIEGLASRNAAAFAQNPNLSALLKKVQKERDGKPENDEILTNVYRARDAYLRSKSQEAATSLQANLNIARAFLEDARAVISSLAKMPPQ